jgi:hypothetical protein
MDPHGRALVWGRKPRRMRKMRRWKLRKAWRSPKRKGDHMQIDSKEVKKPVPAEGIAEKKEGESLEFRLSYVPV